MDTHSHLTSDRDPAELYAPNGKLIVGTADELLATAHVIDLSRRPDGGLSFDCSGDSKMHWDTQTQRRDARGIPLWTDTDGRDWPQTCLSLGNEPLKPMPAENQDDEIYHLSTAAVATIIDALRLLQRDMLAQEPETAEPRLDLAQIDTLCEYLNTCGSPPDAAAEDILGTLASSLRELKAFGGPGGTEAEEAAETALTNAEQFLD